MQNTRVFQATERMISFAERTGVVGERPARRYLWTDAFAVCNFLGLADATGEAFYLELALRLVDQVHRELGRFRHDDRRTGRLSGLRAVEAATHPTRGGLRIGKSLPERQPTEPYNASVEWERDGQYFHYLTKWMHALDQLARRTGQAKFNTWARELAETARHAFILENRGRKRMLWKMSTDLSRSLVPSMGQHDPLDGLITCMQLTATAAELGATAETNLSDATRDFEEMLSTTELATTDTLGLGSLLADACRLAQVNPKHVLVGRLLSAAHVGLEQYLAAAELREPAAHRLAFRELGLAIGLAGISSMQESLPGRLSPFAQRGVEYLAQYTALRDEIESFWGSPAHAQSTAWRDHQDINDVMLATSLLPAGFLRLDAGAATNAVWSSPRHAHA